MAAAAIPLVTSLLPTVIPLFAKLADKLFGSKTGPAKLDWVTTLTQGLNQALIAAGKMDPKDSATLNDIQTVVNSVVAGLNASGELKGEATTVLPTAAPAAGSGSTVINLNIDAKTSGVGLKAFLKSLSDGVQTGQ